MKKLVLFSCFLFLILSGFSQQIPPKTTFIGKDSVPFNFEENWRFVEGDNPAFASVDFNDSKWVIKNCALLAERGAYSHWFKGVGWFRLHLIIDTFWVGKPMAIRVSHFGASEIYLDGILIKSFGKINGSDSSVYFNPHNVPFTLTFSKAGEHILAVRYANYKAMHNYDRYWSRFAGFSMSLDENDSMIKSSISTTAALSFIFSILLGIFFAMALLHLFMYLYYRSVFSNLYFSLFAFCLAAIFFISFARTVGDSPSFIVKSSFLIFPIVCTACLALSGFIHELFYKKGKKIFYSILAIYLMAVIFPLIGWGWAIFINFLLIFICPLEAVIMIIIAIRRKVKGARIIGFGVLFFGLFLLSIFVAAFIVGDIVISDNTTGGAIIAILMACAILSMPFSMSAYLAWSFSSVSKNLVVQFENVKLLSQKSIEQEQEKNKLITDQNIVLEQKVEERTADLKAEKKKSDDLLLNILPAEIAEELKAKGETQARQFDMVSVLFTDFVNFTGISSTLTPTELVKEIDICFKAIDEIIGRNGLEKIKTIGDAYLAVCGMPETDSLHAIKVVRAAIDIKNYIIGRKKEGGKFEIRIGIHSGPLVAGIVGIKKFAYDIWGDTVNLASRMESNSEPGKINISGATYELVKDEFRCEHRGKIEAKNKGMIDMYFVLST